MAGIIILGANGSGKSTIGRKLANLMNCVHFEAEDYWFHKTKIPYTVSRLQKKRNKMLLSDIKKHDSYVVSGDLSNWSEAFLKSFDLAVFIEVPTSIRVKRIEKREYKRFGNRICEGGDMCVQHLKFIEYAKSRNIDLLKKKATKYSCPVIYIDGTENYNNINFYNKIIKIKNGETKNPDVNK